MKIFLLHGDNTTLSYERLMKYVEHAKKRDWDIIHYSDKSQNLSQLVRSDSLFETDKLVIVDNFELLTKKDLDWLTEESAKLQGNLVIHHNKLLPKTKIDAIPKLEKAEEFVYPVILWKMIDAFYPKNTKSFLLLMHQVLEKEPVELVFGLLAKQIRDLYWVLIDPVSCPMPEWKIGKMQATARKFSKEQLEAIIEELAAIDVLSKTSDTDMKDLLDLLVVRHLQ